MSRIQTLQEIMVERGIDAPPKPGAPPLMEPPPTENEPEDDDDFDPRSVFGTQRTPPAPVEFNQLRPGTERQLAAFETLRASLGFSPDAPRPPATDPTLVAALAQRWGDDLDPLETLRYVGVHDPAGSSTIDFLHLMFGPKDRIVLRHRDDGPSCPHAAQANSLGPMIRSDDLWFQINPIYSEKQGYRRVLLRFGTLPEDTGLRILLRIPVWVRSIYRRPGFPVEALIEIDACTPGEFHDFIVHLGPHLAAVGADPECLNPTAFSRLPAAQRSDDIEDILYMDTRPIGVDARPIVSD